MKRHHQPQHRHHRHSRRTRNLFAISDTANNILLNLLGEAGLIAVLCTSVLSSSFENTVRAIVPTVAAYDFGCAAQWKGPSADNDPMSCLMEWPLANLGMLTPPVLPLAFAVLLIVLFPLVYCCRCLGGFGSNRLRPGADCMCAGEEWDEAAEHETLLTYPRFHQRCFRITIVVLTVVSVAAIPTTAFGVQRVVGGLDTVITSTKTDVLDWAMALISTVEEQTRQADGSYISPITNETFAPFHNVHAWGSDMHNTLRTVFDRYMTVVRTIVFVMSGFSSAAMTFVCALAFFNIRTLAPRLLQPVYFVIALIFAVAATAVLAVAVVAVCFCGEVDLHHWGAPGVMQWFAVPMCERDTALRATAGMLREMELDNSMGACRGVMQYCDDNETYDMLTSPDRVFFCPELTEETLPSVCGAFATMSATIREMTFKAAASAIVCPSCETFVDCSTNCTDASLKATAQETIDLLHFAGNASDLIDRYAPELDCDRLITRFLQPFYSSCDDMSVGLFLVGGGATLSTLIFIWAILLLCKGQKLFFSRAAMEARQWEAMEERSNPHHRVGGIAPQHKKGTLLANGAAAGVGAGVASSALWKSKAGKSKSHNPADNVDADFEEADVDCEDLNNNHTFFSKINKVKHGGNAAPTAAAVGHQSRAEVYRRGDEEKRRGLSGRDSPPAVSSNNFFSSRAVHGAPRGAKASENDDVEMFDMDS